MNKYNLMVNPMTYEKLKKMSNNSLHAMNAILVSAVVIVVCKYSNDDNIPIGEIEVLLSPDITAKDLILKISEQIKNSKKTISEFSDVSTVFKNIQKFDENLDKKISFNFFVEENTLKISLKTELGKEMLEHFSNILDEILKDVNMKLSDIKMLSEQDYEKIANKFNDNKNSLFQENTIYELIDIIALKNPDKIAIKCGSDILTYRGLKEKSDKVAHVLLSNYKVSNENTIGIIMERSIEYVTSILGIFKASCAYIPIDITYPESRIIDILKDSETNLVFSTAKNVSRIENLQQNLKVMCVDDLNNFKVNSDTAQNNWETKSDNLAYIIYTSGSTGKPKGAMVEHLGMLNHIQAKIEDLNLNDTSIVAQNASECFDISVWQFLAVLSVGGKVVIYKNNDITDVNRFIKIVNDDKITILELVPSYLSVILETIQDQHNNFNNLKHLIVTGEEVKANLIKNWFEKFPDIKIMNAYGPTEASDDITHFIMSTISKDELVPIGKPIRNTNVYILDKLMNICPAFVKGEICVSGICVGRGYLNDIEKTNEVFIKDIIKKDNSKLYKTGDIGYFNENGHVVFCGRKDTQIKIRGFRVELLDIENNILKFHKIEQAVVLLTKKSLSAYIIANQDCTNEELKEFLKSILPHYMIPHHFYFLDFFPLTSNGKIDKRGLENLPINIKNDGILKNNIVSNEIQKILIEVFKGVLSLPNISIDDDLFELGIDSIKAMQASARLQKYKIELKIRDIFNFPNIKSLSLHVRKVDENVISQESVSGDIPLIPIQKWFFEQNFENPNHYNQAIMLYRSSEFDSNIVKKCFDQIIMHHDALRIVFSKDQNENIVQNNLPINANKVFYEFYEAMLREDKLLENFLANNSTAIHKKCSIFIAPLLRLGLFKTKNQGDYLLITVNHLIIDAVSLRIIVDDFHLLYSAYLNGRKIQLQDKTTSFKEFSNKMLEQSNLEEVSSSKKIWEEIEYFESPIIKKNYDILEEDKKLSNFCVEKILLDTVQTKKLLKAVNEKLKVNLNIVLITMLGEAIKKWCKKDKLKIHLEGHGRDELFDNVNLSKTIGWFTSLFPFILDVSKEKFIDNLAITKNNLEAVQNNSSTYGILKYLTKELDEKENSNPEILFNFLGNFDDIEKYSEFSVYDINVGDLNDKMAMGEVFSLENRSPYTLEISSQIKESRLEFFIAYNKYQFENNNIQRLSALLKNMLCDLITDNDYIKEIVDNNEKYYPVLSSQKRLFLIQEFDKSSTEYNLPLIVRIQGKLNKDKIENIFNEIVQRHEPLRTSFELKENVYQKINKDAKLNFEFEKLEGMDIDIDFEIKKFIKPFDLRKGNLFRVNVLETNNPECSFLMTDIHHIISDGFSSEIIINEFLRLYNLEKLPNLSTTFQKIVELQNENLNKTYDIQEKYWLTKFDNLPNKTIIPYDYSIENLNKKICKIIEFEIPSEKIKKIVAQEKITLNTVLFAVYNIILSKITNSDDLITGIVNSGRDDILSQNLVGMFVNTLPIRLLIDKDKSFVDFSKYVQKNILETVENQIFPFDELIEKLNLKRDNRNPLFINMFAPQNISFDRVNLNDILIEAINLKSKVSDFDFTLVSTELENKIILGIEYLAELYKEDTIIDFIELYKSVINQVADNKNLKLKDINLFSERETIEMVENKNIFENLDLDF